MNSKKPDYHKLKKTWYKKLKDSGFNDIEYADGSIPSGLSPNENQNNPLTRQAITEYYYLATHFLNEHKFNSELEKTIWGYHADGISSRDISELLTKTKVAKMKRTKIQNIIRILKQKMKAMYLSV